MAHDWKKTVLERTKGQLHAILACALKMPSKFGDKPKFYSGPVQTSDGFVLCGFIDQNGDDRGLSFVTSVSEIRKNVEGLVEFLKTETEFTEDDATAFREAMKGWI